MSRLRIDGLRGVRAADVRLTKHCALVGPNGCGKSTVIDALSLVLGRVRMVRALTEHDFTGSQPTASSRIKVIATLTGFASELPGDHDQWFRADRAVPKWLDENGVEWSEPGKGRNLCVNIGFCARFDLDELDVEVLRYFHDDDDIQDPFNEDGGVVQVQRGLLNEIGFYVLPARRDWEGVASFNSELFRRTVSNSAGIPAEDVLAQRDALREPPVKLEDSKRMQGLVSGLNERLSRLAPNAPEFGLRVTTGDSAAVLQALLPHYTRPGGPTLPAIRHGAGLVALQSLLLLLEVGKARRAKGLQFILALEEPELHLSPGIHRRLVAEAVDSADQVIATTHSPDVARVFPPTSVMIAANDTGRFLASPFLKKQLTSDASNNERKLFLQNRARVVSALMYPFVLVPEGRFDAEWLSRISDVADSQMASASPFGATFGVVPTENAAVRFTATSLMRLRSRIVAFVDGDDPGNKYVEELLDEEESPKLIVQLPLGWTIEDLVCWMLEGSEHSIPALQREIEGFQFSNMEQFRELLKTSNDRKKGVVGLKEDVLVHDVVAGQLEMLPGCRKRAVKFCEAMVDVAYGTDGQHMTIDETRSTSEVRVVRFQP